MKFFKLAQEYAKGIPDRNVRAKLPSFKSPQTWEFVVQKHDAKRAGTHFDLRLGDTKTGQGHSWALRNLPAPGEKTLAVEQPTHTIEYFKFQGSIPSGYGAGDVSTHVLDKAEVIHSEPDKITFYLYNESTPQKYTLMRMEGTQWLLMNHTTTKPLTKYFNTPVLNYKTTDEIKPGDFVTPKIDGAYGLTILKPGKKPVVFGKRTSARTGRPIEYTPKLFNMLTAKVPKSLGTTILRTEIYGITPDGKELPNRTLGGLLNSGVWKSRQLQKGLSTPLRLAAFDVLKYKGKNVGHLPIEKRYEIIKEISKKFPVIENPIDVAKRVPFNEGYVLWRNNKPYKLKNRPEFDVYAKEIFPTEKGDRAGGFKYSLTPNGPIVGNVGTGFTHPELKEMLNNPEDYSNRWAKIYSQEQLPSGAYRAPSFYTWHLDK